jgi:hypothetical protein
VLTVLVVVVAGCGSGGPPSIVRIGSRGITSRELAHWQKVRAGGEHGPAEVRDAVLTFLIHARWLEGWAGPSVKAAVKLEAAKRTSLFEYARIRGLSEPSFSWEQELKPYLTSAKATAKDRLWIMTLSVLHRRLARQRLRQAARTVTQAQIAHYYDEQGQMFFVPEERDMAIMESYSRPAMLQARRELEAGVSPRTVARRFSNDPVNPNGLRFGYVRGTGGAASLDAAIFSAKPRAVVGPLQVAMYYVFEVRAIRRRHRSSLSEVSGQIKLELAAKAPSEALQRGFEKLWKSRTDCQRAYIVVGCRQDDGGSSEAR